mmetsp:Transcript_119/g.362  ORF Transcript_119/g.362 Transcript_119/m.362 type:complete len:230 (-) Transcript_119:553-1242(-)
MARSVYYWLSKSGRTKKLAPPSFSVSKVFSGQSARLSRRSTSPGSAPTRVKPLCGVARPFSFMYRAANLNRARAGSDLANRRTTRCPSTRSCTRTTSGAPCGGSSLSGTGASVSLKALEVRAAALALSCSEAAIAMASSGSPPACASNTSSGGSAVASDAAGASSSEGRPSNRWPRPALANGSYAAVRAPAPGLPPIRSFSFHQSSFLPCNKSASSGGTGRVPITTNTE